MALRCLIVDDNQRFADAACELLVREGLDVLGAAATSAEALERSLRLRPDLTLVDIALGEESGLDLARCLVRSGATTWVVLISTYAKTDFEDLIAASPAAGFLSKRELSRHAIERVLEASNGRRGR